MENEVKKSPAVKKALFFFLLALIFIFTAVVYEILMTSKARPEMITKEFQSAILYADKKLSQCLDTLSTSSFLSDLNATDSILRTKTFPEEGFSYFKYYNDSLAYWSDNSVPLPENYDHSCKNACIITLENGYYYFRVKAIGKWRVVGMVLIKHKYPYQNIYLENRYQDGFDIPSFVNISNSGEKYKIYSPDRSFLCALDIKPPAEYRPYRADILMVLYALAFLALAASLFQLYMRFRSFLRSDLLLVITYSLDIIILRVLMFIFKLPSGLYHSHLFSPGSFATSDYIPSLGDFLFNGLALLSITYVLFLTYKNIGLGTRKPPLRRYFIIFLLFLHIFIFYRLFVRGAESLIMDSSYSLNLNRFFFLSSDSFLALFTFTLILFSFFLVSYRILGLVYHHTEGKAPAYFGILSLTTLTYLGYCYIFHDWQWMLLLPLMAYVIVFYFLSGSGRGADRLNFTSSVLYLFIFAILSTALLAYYNNTRETEQRRLMAIDLASGDDPLSEYIFQTVYYELGGDSTLLSLLSEVPENIEMETVAEEYIIDNYLADRMRRFEYIVTLCTPYRKLNIQPEGYIVNCTEYFNSIIKDVGQPTLDKNLYRYDNEAGLSNYISRQDFILNEGKDSVSVFIELLSYFFPGEGLGYPELLIDEKLKTFAGLENYSYARYKNGNLIFKYGDYPYSTQIDTYLRDDSSTFFSHNMSTHLISQAGPGDYVVISKNDDGFLEVVAPFSYLLIFFTLFILAFLLSVNLYYTRTRFEMNFRNRLQAYIISLIIASFVIVGYITVSYVIRLNTTKNQEILKEKTHSVLIELEHKLSGEPRLTTDMEEYLTNLLIKFSQVFFSDINLYNLDGRLLASSRPQIFQKQLISTRLNADAYRSLTVDKKLMYLHTEKIGDHDYYSAYVPFMNADNHVVAYLNLPYFARQTELQSEISDFLNAFLNVYVLMMAMSILFAVLISRFTTQPLQMIQDKMRSLSLGGTNEKISWSGKDEIGTLIAEYNRMIDELSRSADLLAKSERESAWREMAKQVAHEIKNPLTPMKLSVQYLQKAWDEKSPDWEERLSRFTQTIIEHIDTLSDIASEFSDFAKMPQKKEEKLDLSHVIQKSIDLFSDTAHITFRYEEKVKAPQYVMADKNQLIRVFNNLIKNSVQAIGKKKKGLVEVRIDREEDHFLISVADNGPGIPDDMVDKIFSPSFTTKSSGMGLGLALVRSIVQEAGGEISFTSSPDHGTIFMIKLPAC